MGLEGLLSAPYLTVTEGALGPFSCCRRLVCRFAWAGLGPLHFLHGLDDPLPHRRALHVATLQHSVRTLGSFQGGTCAVLADEDAG